MSKLVLPHGFGFQPQYPAPIDYQGLGKSAVLVSLLTDVPAVDLARGNSLTPSTTSPAVVVRNQGKALLFDGVGTRLQSAKQLTPGATFTVFAWARPSALNTNYARLVETEYASGFYLGSNTASKYCWIVNNASLEGCIGGQQVAGQRDFVCGVFDGTNRILYVNGVQVASSAATSPSAARTVYVGAYGYAGSANYWAGDIDTVGIFDRAFTASEVAALYQNPWQLFKAPARRLWVATASSGINLIGANSSQANASSAGAISQTHILTGANSSQADSSSTGAVTQTHVLAGSNSSQANASSTGAVSQTHRLTGANASQANAASTGSINKGSLVAANCAQANLSGTGAVVVIDVYLPAANSDFVWLGTASGEC